MRLADHRREIAVLAGHKAVFGIQFYSPLQVFVRPRAIGSQSVSAGECVMDVLGIGRHLERSLQVGASLIHFARVEQRNPVIVVVFDCIAANLRLLEALGAHSRVEPGTVRHIPFGALRRTQEQVVGFAEFAGVEQFAGSLEVG